MTFTLVLKKIRFSFYHLIHQRYQAWDRFLLCVVNFFLYRLIHQRYQAWDRFPINVIAVSSQSPRKFLAHCVVCLFV